MNETRKLLEKKLRQVSSNAAFLADEHLNLRGSMLSYFLNLKRQVSEAEKLYIDLWKLDTSENPEAFQSTSGK